MKKRLSVICIAAATALLLSAFSCSSDTASSMKIYGDLDTDGSVTSADALQVLRFGVSMDTCDEEEKLLSDVDGDGVITAADALDILRYSIGFDTGSLTGKPTDTSAENASETDARSDTDNNTEIEEHTNTEVDVQTDTEYVTDTDTDITKRNKTLVAYFSRTGHTEAIADYVAELTGADSFEIEAAVPYSEEDIEYTADCRANREQNDKTVRPEIKGAIDNMEQYDTVYLGYAIWWGQEPMIIDTFLESYDFSRVTIIPFCTSASSGISQSESNIRELGVEIGELKPGRRFSIGSTKDEVAQWLGIAEGLEANNMIYAHIGDETLTIELAENSSAQAFAELLGNNDITVEMHDYGSFEKVGSLGHELPRNDEYITTEPGDVILYQGDQITIYYDVNSWDFTRLGKVIGRSQQKLKEILGSADITVVFSVEP